MIAVLWEPSKWWCHYVFWHDQMVCVQPWVYKHLFHKCLFPWPCSMACYKQFEDSYIVTLVLILVLLLVMYVLLDLKYHMGRRLVATDCNWSLNVFLIFTKWGNWQLYRPQMGATTTEKRTGLRFGPVWSYGLFWSCRLDLETLFLSFLSSPILHCMVSFHLQITF